MECCVELTPIFYRSYEKSIIFLFRTEILCFNSNVITDSWFHFLVSEYTVNSLYNGHRRDRLQLSVLDRCPSYREFSYSKMTEKRQRPSVGVRLIEVSVKREVTVSFFS